MNKSWCVLLFVGLVSLTAVLQADVLLERTGPFSSNIGVNVDAVGWSQTNTWTGVEITLQGYDYHQDAVPQSADVYLTTMIGPGTTSADEIAHAVLSATTYGAQTFTVFTGLNLGPGTYYLTFYNPDARLTFDGLFWSEQTPGTPITQVGTGITDAGFFGTNTAAGYVPASAMASDIFAPLFTITGTPGAVPAPEPTGALLLAFGLAALAGSIRLANHE